MRKATSERGPTRFGRRCIAMRSSILRTSGPRVAGNPRLPGCERGGIEDGAGVAVKMGRGRSWQ